MYVDYDPVVLSHARALLTSDPAGATDYVDADLRAVEKVLDGAAATLDLATPVAVIIAMTLHAISDEDDPYAIVAQVMAAMPSGSYLAISYPASDVQLTSEGVVSSINRLSYQQYRLRTHAEVLRFFDGLDLVEPGLVQVHRWRPDTEPDGSLAAWAGIGRK